MNSDSEDEEILSDIELTAEELAEAEASLAAKHAKSKSTGDIVVPIDATAETKKVFLLQITNLIVTIVIPRVKNISTHQNLELS